jgi:hypothetical protein
VSRKSLDSLNEHIMSRGSRKHVLDWTSRPTFCVELLKLAMPIKVRISAESVWMPRGHEAPEEARLESFGPRALPETHVWTNLRRWWLRHERGANTPNWDIALACEIEARPGLLLVEAKANVPELGASGKLLDPSASIASQENHERIRAAINEACTELCRISSGVRISRDSHYQLSNRVAFAWKLASLGVPTIVMYLGFSGDSGIADAGEPFRDAAHWHDAFAAYAHSLMPKEMFERRVDCLAAPMWLLIRSRPVIEVSGPRLSNNALEPAAP